MKCKGGIPIDKTLPFPPTPQRMMRKISGQMLSTKPVSLSRASKLISRFASIDNGSSAAVSSYLHRSADAFNHLVQFHNKRSKNSDIENSPDQKMAGNSLTDRVEEKLDVNAAQQDSRSRGKRDRKTVDSKEKVHSKKRRVERLNS